MSDLLRSLEAALVENPDDLAAHAAYADLLMERGDPRGEFIQVQMALEDPRRPASERKRLQARERALWKKHGDEWLGDLAHHMAGIKQDYPHCRCRFARGWLDEVVIDLLGPQLAHDLAAAPQARLLLRLVIEEVEAIDLARFEDVVSSLGASDALSLLAGSPHLRNVRALYLGTSDGFVDAVERISSNDWHLPLLDDGRLKGLVGRLPRLEELVLWGEVICPERLAALRAQRR